MICITGIPGTGKSTLCLNLNRNAATCRSANDEAQRLDCVSGDVVDIGRLRAAINGVSIIEGHYTHLLDCECAIILTASEETIRKRLLDRGYSREKVEENIGAMLSDSIYYEALDRLPAGRIFKVSTDGENEGAVLARVMEIISLVRGNNKS
ncbi:MAG: AAA family ATPase [Candidatus Thermoplasmatota archaeon]|nr:AAA family ATPase [Candidatus Thermoplasmatota archaeon]